MSGYNDMEVDGGSSDYLKLKAGEVVSFNILSQKPEKEIIHWQNKKRVKCLGKEKCELCMEGDKPKQRWNIMVWDRKEQKEKKFEFGASIAGQIKAIAEMQHESQSDIHKTDLRIKTTGSGLETEYTVLPAPINGTIPGEVKAKYSSDEVPF